MVMPYMPIYDITILVYEKKIGWMEDGWTDDI